MKVPEKTIEKKEKIKKREKVKPTPKKKEHVLIVAQEIRFARLLSGNEKKTRDKVLNTLKKWLLNCFEKGYDFKEDDFIRVWKGLFYAVWMSDKPLVQEELCEKIAGVLDLFPESHLHSALLMFKAGLRVLATEWYGLDQHRTDKFLMLVRRYLRASLRSLLRSEWSLKSCQMYAKTLSGTDGIFALKTPHYARNSMSMLLHIVDCFLEEIAKVSNGDIPEASLVELLRPLCTYMCEGEAPSLCAAARRLLTALLRQSEQGLQYQQATQAWQKMGCPVGGPEALELVSDSENDDDDQTEEHPGSSDDDNDESSEKPLDPRAGRVNVELACLPVPATLIADMLRGMLATASSVRHKRVKICLERFEQLSRSEYPLRVLTHVEDNPAPSIKQKQVVKSLQALEKKLAAASDDLALRGLSRKHRKRLLAKSRTGTSIIEEVEAVRQKLSTNVTNGGWQVETSEPKAKKPNQNTTNKDNIKKRKNNTIDASDKKRKLNGDATHKQQNVAKKQKVSKGNKTVVTKLENAKCIENGQKKDKVSQNSQKIKEKGSKKSNEKVIKVTENGVKNVKSKISVNKVLISEAENNVADKNNKKTQKNHDKVLINGKYKKLEKPSSPKIAKNEKKPAKQPTLLVNKVKQFQKKNELHKKTELQKKMSKINKVNSDNNLDTPKKVKFALKNNSMQQPVDYYKSVRQSPSIPFDSSRKPSKTNLKPSTPSPINPFFKKKLRLKH